MKKNLLIVALLLGLSLGVSAQSKEYKGFAFGFKVGPNLNWIGSNAEDVANLKAKVGLNFGFDAEFYFAENYAIVSGLNVNLINGRYSFEDMRQLDTVAGYTLGTVDRNFKATVFEIPLMVKMVTEQFGPLRYFAQIGGAFGYTYRTKIKDTFDETAMHEKFTSSDKEYNPFRFSLRAAVGTQYTIQGTSRVFLDVYYSHDMINNISSGGAGLVSSNYRKYYAGNKDLGERTNPLHVVQNQVGIEVGILF